jgi:hypothetical protein
MPLLERKRLSNPTVCACRSRPSNRRIVSAPTPRDPTEEFCSERRKDSFCEAIRLAKEQKSISLEKRAEAIYAEYRRQKAGGSGGRGFRLPLW